MSAETRAEHRNDRVDVASLLAHQRTLQENNEKLESEVLELKRQLEWFKKQLFGSRSERRLLEPSPDQLSLGEGLADTPRSSALSRQIAGYTRKAPRAAQDEGSGALRFDARVPMEVIEIGDPEAGDPREVIGEKTTYRLAQRPGSYVVIKYVRKVFKDLHTGDITCVPAPAGVFERSHADVSFLAGLIIDKFQYHLPLYRQHQRLLDAGVEVARSWLTQLVHKAASLLEPIYLAQLESIRAGPVIAIDETPIKATRKSRGRMKTTYYWPVYGHEDEVAFPWFTSRASPHVASLLGEYSGTLLSDGYAAYARYAAATGEVVHAQCWAHTRRQFLKAEAAEPELAAAALDQIAELYAEERVIAHAQLEGIEKLAHRGERSQPIAERFFLWCEERLHDKALLPSNPLTQALGYALERRNALSVFLADADVPIDTNHLERALRPIPLGRKNWLFCWTEIGAKYVGILQSLLVTCRLHKIHPYTYLVDVLQRIDSHPASQVQMLTPRLWKAHFAADPMRAPLDLLRQ